LNDARREVVRLAEVLRRLVFGGEVEVAAGDGDVAGMIDLEFARPGFAAPDFVAQL
jgi:hypothetical protein